MVIAPARRAGDPGSIPGPGENFSLKLLINSTLLTPKIMHKIIILIRKNSCSFTIFLNMGN